MYDISPRSIIQLYVHVYLYGFGASVMVSLNKITWRHVSVMAFQITGNSKVCWTTSSVWEQRNIIITDALWRESKGDRRIPYPKGQ